MKKLRGRWTLVVVSLFAVALIFTVAFRRPSPVDKVTYVDAVKVPHTLSSADWEIQDSLVAKLASNNQFAEMSPADQEQLISVANATWYKDGVVWLLHRSAGSWRSRI